MNPIVDQRKSSSECKQVIEIRALVRLTSVSTPFSPHSPDYWPVRQEFEQGKKSQKLNKYVTVCFRIHLIGRCIKLEVRLEPAVLNKRVLIRTSGDRHGIISLIGKSKAVDNRIKTDRLGRREDIIRAALGSNK